MISSDDVYALYIPVLAHGFSEVDKYHIFVKQSLINSDGETEDKFFWVGDFQNLTEEDIKKYPLYTFDRTDFSLQEMMESNGKEPILIDFEELVLTEEWLHGRRSIQDVSEKINPNLIELVEEIRDYCNFREVCLNF